MAGADTGVGKDVISSAAVAALRQSCEVGYWNAVQTGIEADDDSAEVRRLAACETSEIGGHGFLLRLPLTPHLAARFAGLPFTVSQLIKIWERRPARQFWVVADDLTSAGNTAGRLAQWLNETRALE